jgi:hypothetical protein
MTPESWLLLIVVAGLVTAFPLNLLFAQFVAHDYEPLGCMLLVVGGVVAVIGAIGFVIRITGMLASQ